MHSFYCWGLIAFVVGAIVLCSFMLFIGYILGERSCIFCENRNTPFESGISSVGDARVRFFIGFYLIAIFFVIFDIEGIYIYIWAISVRDLGWLGFFEIFLFIFVLLVSLIYLLSNDIFNWNKKVVLKY